MDGICTFCENILPREYGRSDPTEKYDDQKSGIVETAFSDHLQRSDRHLCTGTRIWHRNDARRKCGESKCDRGGDERTCVFLYVFRSDHCFDLIRSSSDRFDVLVNKQIYENFAEGNMPVIHAVLSSLVPLYEAICLFIMRKRPFVR